MMQPLRPSILTAALQAAADTRGLEIGHRILRRTPEFFEAHFGGRPAVVVADGNTFEAAGREVNFAMQSRKPAPGEPIVFEDRDLYAEHRFVERLEGALRQTDSTPIAVGSGTINDLTKLAAHRVGRPYMAIATAASMDGYTAYGASITFNGSKQTFDCPAPRLVVADLDVIASAPPEMNAAGYADLTAKLTAGADWIVADALGVERIDPRAWEIVQAPLRGWLADPAGVCQARPAAIEGLVEGLMMGGFAMQWSKTSRPASGAEHQFSHLWDMQHHTHEGAAPSHGFKVGVATVAITRLYERLMARDLSKINIERACECWLDWPAQEHAIRQLFDPGELAEKAVEESKAKYVPRDAVRRQLLAVAEVWDDLRGRLSRQLIPSPHLARMLEDAGAPSEPQQIGISPQRLGAAFRQAYHIRRRFTVLDLTVRANLLDELLRGE